MCRKLIIDTDPGVDDMVAILSALQCEEIELLAITTVGGNVGIPGTTRNALRILARAGRNDVPVYAGLAGSHTAEHVHGDDGLHGCLWPEAPRSAELEGAVDFLARTLGDEDVTLACLGPLTNLAAVLGRRPDLTGHVVLMGGGFGTYSFRAGKGVVDSTGNVTAEAEFNIFSDIAAAKAVFASQLEVTVVPLDISQRTLVSRQRLETLERHGPLGQDIAGILDRYGEFSRQRWGHTAGPLHDPNVIARIAEPDMYGGVRGTVRVGEHGRTEFDPGAGRHEVLLQVDAEGYLDWVLERLAASDSVSA